MTRIRDIRLPLLLALGVVAAACAGATPSPNGPGSALGEVRPIAFGETLIDDLAESDPHLEDGSRYDLFTFDGQAGDAIEVNLLSEDFDAYLALGQEAGGDLKIITSDDDGGEGLDARITTRLPRTGRYVVRANSLAQDETGEYRIQLSRSPEPSRTVIRPGETRSGELSSGDASIADGDYYDLWIFEGTANEVIRVDLMSDGFDALLAFGRENDGEFVSIQTDDDGGDNLNSRIYATLPETGQYVVRASSLGQRSTGVYEIRVASEGPAEPASREPIGMDEERDGELSPSDGRLADGSFHDIWTYDGAAGEAVRIDLSSDDFDSYLQLGTETGGVFEELESDDDGGTSLDSRIRTTLPATRQYVIRAQSLRSGQTGRYRVRLSTPAPQPPATREAISIDEPRDGSLSESDSRLDNDAHHDLWIYEGRAGETIEIDLVSEDFDTYIGFGYERNGEFRQLDVDDDGGDDTNSRLVITLTEDRPYVIRATSYGADQTGAYRITVTGGTPRS